VLKRARRSLGPLVEAQVVERRRHSCVAGRVNKKSLLSSRPQQSLITNFFPTIPEEYVGYSLI
jgi:hypothetical protein